jgi:putative membrane protein
MKVHKQYSTKSHHRLFRLTVCLLILVSGYTAVGAHPGQPIAPHDLSDAWNTELSVLLLIEILIGIYAVGVFRLWLRAGIGHGIGYRQVGAFIGTVLALLAALVSPLDALGHALFSAHMLQHLILILVVPPLLIWSELPVVILYAVPKSSAHWIGQRWNARPLVRSSWHFLTNPVSAWILSTGFLWLWHLPTFFQATLQNESIHAVEHLGFVGTALLFWWVLLKPKRQKHKAYLVAAAYLFLSAMQGSFLGTLLVFASTPWYPAYSQSVLEWNLTLLQDQQLAGLIMWIPIGTLFTLLATVYFFMWLRALEARTSQARPKSLTTELPTL